MRNVDLAKRLGVALPLMMLGGIAFAAPVDNPGEIQFESTTGSNVVLEFSTFEELEMDDGTFRTYIESTGDTLFVNSNFPASPTLQGVGASPVTATLEFTDIAGITDASSGRFLSWTIKGFVRFSASGAGVNSATCKTPIFTAVMSGDWFSGATSSAFTIPALTASCNGHSAEISGDFGLGTGGATLTLNKWGAYNVDGGGHTILTGS
jgi:hypothetical protein